MFSMYFGKQWALITTILFLGFIAFAVFLFIKRDTVPNWGRFTLLGVIWGLVLCCTATMRDGYHLSIQHAIDGSVSPGLFGATGLQTIIGGVLAAVAVLCALLTIFFQNQNVREVLFFVMSSSMILKIAFIEISRISIYIAGTSQWRF